MGMIFLIIGFSAGIVLGLMRDGCKDEKLERVAYEMGRLINALRMEKGLNPWTKYEIKRCEEVFKEKNKQEYD